jgi:hypothetical protein
MTGQHFVPRDTLTVVPLNPDRRSATWCEHCTRPAIVEVWPTWTGRGYRGRQAHQLCGQHYQEESAIGGKFWTGEYNPATGEVGVIEEIAPDWLADA